MQTLPTLTSMLMQSRPRVGRSGRTWGWGLLAWMYGLSLVSSRPSKGEQNDVGIGDRLGFTLFGGISFLPQNTLADSRCFWFGF